MSSEIKQRTVYKLVRTDKPEDGTDIYVGSTSLSLKKRLQLHKHDVKRCTYKFHTRMSEVGTDKWKILPLLTYSCDQGTIKAFEQQWIETVNADLDTFSPLDTDNKWNHIGKKEYKRSHYYSNIERKKYYCDVCDMSFGYNNGLQRHLKSSKHFWKYIYSVD